MQLPAESGAGWPNTALRAWIKRYFAPATMIIGVVFCVLALARMLSTQSIDISADPVRLAIVCVLAVVNIFLSALAWRGFLHGVCKKVLGWREAVAQIGLVLVGKYVPGKISGIAARVAANSPECTARSVTTATIIEQLGSMAMATLVGCAAFIAPDSVAAAFAVLVLALLVSSTGGCVVRWLLLRWPRLARLTHTTSVEPRFIRHGLLFQCVQWIGLSAIVMLVAHMVSPDQHVSTLLRVAGAYGMAVVIGQVAVIFPGGIGPREGAFVWIAAGSVQSSEALALALALRIVTSGIDLLGGLAYASLRWRSSS